MFDSAAAHSPPMKVMTMNTPAETMMPVLRLKYSGSSEESIAPPA